MSDPRTVAGFRTHVSEELYSVRRQPVVNIKTKEILHYEWLVRFDHDDHLEGVLRPAEISGAIMDLDLAMLARAILAINSDPGGPNIAVNISGASMGEAGFEHALFACLSAYEGPPSKLIIELTETWDMRELDNATHILNQLKSRGHPVCLDDVGAGAASIRYLRALPADWLKIDGNFVGAAFKSDRERAILNAVMSLRDPLNVKFIAEGVENQDLLQFVTDMGFDAAQGYVFGNLEPETRIC